MKTTKPGEDASLQASKPGPAPSAPRSIDIPHSLSVRQLAELLGVSVTDVIKHLMRSGIMANINQAIDYAAASAVATNLGYEAHLKTRVGEKLAGTVSEIKRQQLKGEEAGLQPRPPVVTIMGHVDHGKTRLLDAIRQTNVMATEAGSITQHIGAYQVEVNGHKVTFLDTPGHEAFTAMRARGAQATDIVVLVVAADDGVMPQTLEAIDHARAAGVPIVVAINKIDKPEANPDRVKQQLGDHGLVIEEWGGDVPCVPVSAKEKKGISDLLDNVLAVAEVENLRANPNQPAVGVVIEAGLDKTKGPLATVLVHNGTLRLGNMAVVGTTWGKIKAMFNDQGKQVRKAEPATPVVILGLNGVPQAGHILTVVASEQQARAAAQKELEQQGPSRLPKSVSLDNLFDQITAGKVKALNVILKTDVQGSIEPIKNALQQLGTGEIQVNIIRSASGNVTESDVMLAIASKGLVIGFGTGVEPGARRLAEAEGIDIRIYNIIYELVDDVDKALKGMLKPAFVEVIEGRGETRAVFPAMKKAKAAGAIITEGKVSRGVSARVWRQEQLVVESVVISLRRFKEDLKEVTAGYEAGIVLKDFNDHQIGDVLEFFRKERGG
ncbi:MAG: translation initiation factor IF-2 [Chloroflexi bacterium]|nr:translation initiation factor IF-2 [Chloroflexota bacterium]